VERKVETFSSLETRDDFLEIAILQAIRMFKCHVSDSSLAYPTKFLIKQ
jgi:hypothetical protein